MSERLDPQRVPSMERSIFTARRILPFAVDSDLDAHGQVRRRRRIRSLRPSTGRIAQPSVYQS